MARRLPITLAALLALGLSSGSALADACSGHGHAAGSVLGAVGGGLIGNAITHGDAAGTVGGAVAGGLAGNAIARDIDCNRGRHYDQRVSAYYYYDRHGNRMYEDRDGRYYEQRDYYRRHDEDYDRHGHHRRHHDDDDDYR